MRVACVAVIALLTARVWAEDEVELVCKLASADAAERKYARAALLKSGKQAIAVLVWGQKHKDPEVRREAKSILLQIACPRWATPAPGSKIDFENGLLTRVRDRSSGVLLALVPKGHYWMGPAIEDKDADANYEYNSRRLPVTIPKPFYVGVYEVTHGEWRRVIGRRPKSGMARRRGTDSDHHPLTGVSWSGFQPFLKRTGLRLLTSAEWEYACRAGTTGPRYGKLEEIGVESGLLAKVGTKKPNKFGLYDMIGNAWELCSDTVKGSEGEICRIIRGGRGDSWGRAYRQALYPVNYPKWDVGFRVAREP